jgi:hypothetical protein
MASLVRLQIYILLLIGKYITALLSQIILLSLERIFSYTSFKEKMAFSSKKKFFAGLSF